MSGLRKDTSNMIETTIGECTPGDTFLTGTFGNQATCRIYGRDLLGNVLFTTIANTEVRRLPAATRVWRKKRLLELYSSDADQAKDIIGQTASPNQITAGQETRSNRLVDIFTDDNTIDITTL